MGERDRESKRERETGGSTSWEECCAAGGGDQFDGEIFLDQLLLTTSSWLYSRHHESASCRSL